MPGDLSNPGIEPASLVSLALAGGLFITASPGKHIVKILIFNSSPGRLDWNEFSISTLCFCIVFCAFEFQEDYSLAFANKLVL